MILMIENVQYLAEVYCGLRSSWLVNGFCRASSDCAFSTRTSVWPLVFLINTLVCRNEFTKNERMKEWKNERMAEPLQRERSSYQLLEYCDISASTSWGTIGTSILETQMTFKSYISDLQQAFWASDIMLVERSTRNCLKEWQESYKSPKTQHLRNECKGFCCRLFIVGSWEPNLLGFQAKVPALYEAL